MTKNSMTVTQVVAAFADLQPDADVATETALKNPRRYTWSYRLDKDVYSCREWAEVVEVAEGVAEGVAAEIALMSRPKPGTHWLDVMPAIPLAPSVPVKVDEGGLGNVTRWSSAIVCHITDDGQAQVTRRGTGRMLAADRLRVDIHDPQGFGYALRWFGRQPTDKSGRTLFRQLLHNYLLTPNDAGRLALAEALKAVV